MPSSRRWTISFDLLIAAGIAIQGISLPLLWGHSSDTGSLLGRFSLRYAIILAIHALFTLLLLILFFQRRRFGTWLAETPLRLRYGAFALVVIALVVSGFLPFEPEVRQYLALDLILIGLIVIWHQPAQIPQWILPAVAAIALPFMLITTLVTFPYSPDEAHWADYASSALVNGGVYSHTWLQPPYAIYPGVGWSVAGYGWTLENVSFDIRTGRVWNYLSYLLAFAGIAALTWRLYGKRAAAFSTAFAIMSDAFIPTLDYRPDHQIAFAAVWAVFAAAQARFSHKRRWDALAGLLAALSLELHAIGIALVISIGVYYTAEMIYSAFHQHKRIIVAPLIYFCIGAAVGSAIYYGFNVLPVGGLTPFVSSLFGERLARQGFLVFLTQPSFLDGVLILASFAFIIWRRQAADRFIIGIVLCLCLTLLIVDTQGYRSPVIALYSVPVGVLIAWGFEQRRAAATVCVTAALVGQVSAFVAWGGIADWLRTGSAPAYVYADLGQQVKPYLRSNDVILTTHLLIWGLPNNPHLFSYAGELTAIRRWQLSDPEAVWERVKPTVVIYVPDQMVLNPGAQAYMSAHDFQVCQDLTVETLDVKIYRPDC